MIQPWLIFENAQEALDFYKEAFGVVERYRLEPVPGDIVARVALADSEFWIAGGGPRNMNIHQNVRMVVTVAQPEKHIQRAILAGAKEIFPLQAHHGWRSGKICDPFGHHWEFGHEID
jgi:PhnB protein